MEQINQLPTEQRNPNTADIDRVSTLEIVRRINEEDKKVAYAVERELESIAKAVDAIQEALRSGGRLIYCGCGTSGRLGVLDAAECPPTYSADPGMVVGVIAGGERAMFKAVEGAEDNTEAGREDMKQIHLSAKDVLVGIAASGRTPYVLGAMAYAHEIGAKTVALTCNKASKMNAAADIPIGVETGPEVITGSTRMKCGTAEKMVLNMLSTGAMIRLGKVYGNLMVDVMPTNEKLVRRAISIVATAAHVDEDVARRTLEACGFSVKTAIVMLVRGGSAEEANERLKETGGVIAKALGEV
ncbi:N-acetylmuramic acid 6-phosphate etherase [Candidatus Avoscillospira sp. LCP25S3_F1]|uniref:N-acetylmuramic acid 6-phosphate etherase n=1 Tax=Candidatus Avoscillospira sp. LCP25S3_F1 TaxID=3438825 RepID=UPI003F8E3EEF